MKIFWINEIIFLQQQIKKRERRKWKQQSFMSKFFFFLKTSFRKQFPASWNLCFPSLKIFGAFFDHTLDFCWIFAHIFWDLLSWKAWKLWIDRNSITLPLIYSMYVISFLWIVLTIQSLQKLFKVGNFFIQIKILKINKIVIWINIIEWQIHKKCWIYKKYFKFCCT